MGGRTRHRLGPGGASALLVAFVRRSASHHDPVFDLDLFRVRSFATANAATFIFALGFYAALLTGVEFLSNEWRWSIIQTGFAVAPTPVVAAVTSIVSSRLVDKVGRRFDPLALPAGNCFPR